MRAVHLPQQKRQDKWQWKNQRPAKRGPPLRTQPQQVSVVRLSVGEKLRDAHLSWRKCQLLDANCFNRRGELQLGETGQ